MARASSVFLSPFFLLLLVASEFWLQTSLAHENFVEFSFFIHDDLRVLNATAFFTVPPINGTIPENFPSSDPKALIGGIVVMADPVTTGPDRSSKKIAKAKGIYLWDGLIGAPSLEFVFTVIFNANSNFTRDSTLIYRGHDYITTPVREIAIVGGTGDFRLARGWARFSVYSIDNYSAVFNFTNSVYYGT